MNKNELRSWLDYCDEHHTHHCGFSSRSAQIFTNRPRWLVDVNRLCLVPAEPQHRYVALSYVWGTRRPFQTLHQNIDRLRQPRSLLLEESFSSGDTAASSKIDSISSDSSSDQELPTLPQTIRDVMELTQRIGEKFLWVDSLCIAQDDQENQEELKDMGSIYANAYVTIVAAEGTASCGLRGIDHETPPMDRREANYLRSSDSLHDKIRHHHRQLQASPWNHRAWTFQEQIFSRRLLVFRSTEVCWECHCAVWFENMIVAQGECQDNGEMVAQGLSFGVQPSLWDYACNVGEYNRRALTYPEDALEAFGGILSTLSTAFLGGFICGLTSMLFNASLLWFNKLPLERRDARRGGNATTMPPTWAWAAWGGAISFRDHAGDHESIRPLVRWKYKANNQSHWYSIPSLECQRASGIQTRSDQSGYSVAADMAVWTKQDNQGDFHIPLSTEASRSHQLFTRPMRAFFRVTQVYRDVQALLAGSVGMLTSCEALRFGTNARDFLCEVVAVSELAGNGKGVYNVIWIE